MNGRKFDPVRVFRALGCRTRYGIFCILAGKRFCVGAIAAKLGISQPAASQHLKVLKEAGVVEDSRCGYHVHYKVNEEVIRKTAEFLSALEIHSAVKPCGKGDPECAKKTAAAGKS